MEPNPHFGARRGSCVDEGVDPGAGRQQQRAIARQERFRRLAVEGHHPDIKALHFQRDDSALTAVDEAKPQTFIAAYGNVARSLAIDRIEAAGIAGIGARCEGGPVGAEPPVLQQQNLIAIDRDGPAFPDDQRQRPRRPRLAVAEQPQVAQEGPGLTQRNLEVLLEPGGKRGPRGQGFDGLNSVQPMPVEQCRDRKFIVEGQFEAFAASEAAGLVGRRAAGSPEQAVRLSRTRRAGPGGQGQPGLRLGYGPGKQGWTPNRPQRRSAQSGQKPASIRPEISICHGLDADHFPPMMSSRRRPVREA